VATLLFIWLRAYLNLHSDNDVQWICLILAIENSAYLIAYFSYLRLRAYLRGR